ncbi:MAG: chemotaxis response regulator protein-glutamate methylesterase [Polyangiaceae bacterium]
MTKARVLIVDDSVVIRRLVSNALADQPEIEVIGTAATGRIALARVPQINPDVIVLDVEMPEMNGLETLSELRKTHPRLPVIMFSSLTEKGATVTLEALARGASDYVTKPTHAGSVTQSLERVRDELVPRIHALTGRRELAAAPPVFVPVKSESPRPLSPIRPRSGPVDVVAIGTSTGGPNALADVFTALPPGFDTPVVVVQHMPPVFTRLLAERLSARCPLDVKEGFDGAEVVAGTAWIAPGDFHMTVRREGTRVFLATNQEPPENSCRPAVDVLFRSVASVYGPRALGVVLTGMGQDGLRGSESMHDAGAQILAQDEASSVVWGMPGFVARSGMCEAVLPLSQVAGEILRRVKRTGSLVQMPAVAGRASG